MNIESAQRDMRALGVYGGAIDGLWGPLCEAGYQQVLSAARSVLEKTLHPAAGGRTALAWGQKVDAAFREKVRSICARLGIRDPDWLMACIAFETGERFSPDVVNGAGSGATGLIQFMPRTARGLGTTTRALAKMSAVEQLDFVERYFQPYKGRLKNLGDLYMAILWPAGIGKDSSWELWARESREITYFQNRGLDANRDGVITRGEAVAKIEEKLERGRESFRG